MARTKRLNDPRQMAVAGVQEWFNSLLEHDMALSHGSVYAVTLEDKFEEIERALIAEHEREQGKPTEEGDEDFVAAVFGRTAGYLIGVQVGLRLRGGR